MKEIVRIKYNLNRRSGVFIGIIGVTILFKDWIFADTHAILWADGFDTRLIYWIVNWCYHILFEAWHPSGLWNTNSFFPNHLTLAYSDSLLSIQLLFAPLRMLGIPALVSLYLSLAGICVIGAGLTYNALYRIGEFSTEERILITFCAHFCLSGMGFFVHYQLFGFQLVPTFFLYLYLYLRDFKRKDLFALISLFAVGISFAMYLAPMLFVTSTIISVPMIVKQVRRLGIRQVFQRIGVRGVGIVVSVLIVLYFIQVKPYLSIA